MKTLMTGAGIAAHILALAGCNSGGYDQPANLCAEAGTRCVSVPVRDLLAVDGDTFELRRLNARGGEERVRLRLIGWDSPETGDAARCPEEDALGQKTEARARALFSAGSKVTFLPEGADQYGRTRAHVYLDGTHVGWLLSKDGLARPLEEGRQVDWCG
ncbi:thermonuclease family protein [Henriciella sp. AS95]|uniref:thermonuclease family protein n=1 Tax=Henriciella sp. AS95 TaxID=3135782 RepID=UPI00316D37EE